MEVSEGGKRETDVDRHKGDPASLTKKSRHGEPLLPPRPTAVYCLRCYITTKTSTARNVQHLIGSGSPDLDTRSVDDVKREPQLHLDALIDQQVHGNQSSPVKEEREEKSQECE